MSAELPELERLLSDAAERRYGPGATSRLRAPRRLSGATRRVLTVAAVLALAAIGIQRLSVGDDERSAAPVASPPSGRLAAAYEVFARRQSRPSALETRVLGRRFVDDFLAADQPISSWLLHRTADGGVVAVLGTSAASGQPTLCLFDDDAGSGGGGCTDVDDLVARRAPLVQSGSQRTGDIAYVLVRDDIASVRVRLSGGATRKLPIENNLAYARSARPICAVAWTRRDGSSGRTAVSDPLDSGRGCG